jgi:septal ring factor EnvC (AmiA/AmiB activator)
MMEDVIFENERLNQEIRNQQAELELVRERYDKDVKALRASVLDNKEKLANLKLKNNELEDAQRSILD